jgi:hypothetical protein
MLSAQSKLSPKPATANAAPDTYRLVIHRETSTSPRTAGMVSFSGTCTDQDGAIVAEAGAKLLVRNKD